jgi:hypothetical protein
VQHAICPAKSYYFAATREAGLVQIPTALATETSTRSLTRISRDRTVSTKLTEAEFALIEHLAGDRGQWISEWVRDVLLDAVRDSEPQQKATFAELQAIRLLLINTLEPLLRGEKMTSEQFKELLRYVKNNKRKAAEEMLASYAIGSMEE